MLMRIHCKSGTVFTIRRLFHELLWLATISEPNGKETTHTSPDDVESLLKLCPEDQKYGYIDTPYYYLCAHAPKVLLSEDSTTTLDRGTIYYLNKKVCKAISLDYAPKVNPTMAEVQAYSLANLFLARWATEDSPHWRDLRLAGADTSFF